MDKSELAIFVDMDQTLIHAPAYPDVDGPVMTRAFAAEFIDALKKMTPNVFILTFGETDHQKRVLRRSEISGMSRKVIGRDAKVPRFKGAILIDNLPEDHPVVQYKMANINAPVAFIRVADFLGQYDTELIRVVGEVVRVARA